MYQYPQYFTNPKKNKLNIRDYNLYNQMDLVKSAPKAGALSKTSMEFKKILNHSN